jgi:CheY-like chemotaxis protein
VELGSWHEHAGTCLRVVVETTDPALAEEYRRALELEDVELVACTGPDERRHRRCPLVEAHTCPLVESADLVVSALPIDEMSTREVLRALRQDVPDVPTVSVGLSHADVLRYHPALLGCSSVVPAPADPADVARAIKRALRRKSESPQVQSRDD